MSPRGHKPRGDNGGTDPHRNDIENHKNTHAHIFLFIYNINRN